MSDPTKWKIKWWAIVALLFLGLVGSQVGRSEMGRATAERRAMRRQTSATSIPKIRLSPVDRKVAAETDRVNETLGSNTKEKRRNYFVRHWQGDLSLPISYWVNGFLGNVVAAVAIATIAASADFKDDFRPTKALASVIAIWAVVLAITTWQVCGVWRKYRYVRLNRFWGGCAKLFVVLGVPQTLGQFAKSDGPANI